MNFREVLSVLARSSTLIQCFAIGRKVMSKSRAVDWCDAALWWRILTTQHEFKKSMFAIFVPVFFAFNASGASATDNSSSPSKADIATICFSASDVCHDACDKAVLTGTEYANCNRGCDDALKGCLGGSASLGGTPTSKGLRPERKTKKYVPSN